MVYVVCGKKGSGKTRKMLDSANASIDRYKGNVIFIDDDQRHMYELAHQVRFINAGEYMISTPEGFIGFLCGLFAQDFDLSAIYIDGLLKMIGTDIADLEEFFQKIDALSNRYEVDVIISLRLNPDTTPDFVGKYQSLA